MSDYGRHIEAVAEQLLGKPNHAKGHEWRYGTHGSLAIQVDAGQWYDHEAEEGGGTLDLIMREAGLPSISEAIRWLEEKGYEKPTEKTEKAEKPRKKARITETYDYIDENGELRYQVVRMEPKTFRQRRPDGSGWSWSVKGIEPLPYRLPDMLAKPSATVIIAEGEKDANRLAEMGFLATCNSGGAGKWPESMSPHLEGRRIVILPDNDDAGRKHAELVAASLHGIADSVRIVYLPGLPEKGDPSDWIDAGGTKEALVSMCKDAEVWAPAIPDEPEPDPEPAESPGQPFLALGYNGGSYYYLPRGTEQVASIRSSGHTSASEMMSLAPVEWWEHAYPKGGDSSKGVDWYAAASDCMRRCERRGVYSMRNVRGRGAWYDKGASVLHLGDRLIVDGHLKTIIDHRSQYIYTRQSPMESIIDSEPATDAEAMEVFDLFTKLNWNKPVHGWLTAGWCALAPVCGAMPWRPHLWITAQRGAGKSWVQKSIIHPLLGQSALMVQGGTTEAGIRQALQQDARPVIFDEAESEDHGAQKRMKSVIELARQASSDGSAEIVKGTVSGHGMAFRIRSMFLLGSVNVSLSQGADESRFSVVSLNRPDKSPEEAQRFKDFDRHVGNTLTSERCAAIRARTYSLIPIIRQNASTLAQAVAEHLGSQRIGDQIGTLLAGAISLSRSDAITLDDARAWARRVDLSDAQEADEVSDEMNALHAILQTQVRFDYQKGSMQRALSEVVMAAAGKRALGDDLYSDECNAILARYGLQIDGSTLVVSNTHAELKRILRDTPWAAGWRRVLARLPGAVVKSSPVRFGGTQTRAVAIPLDAFM